MNKLKILTLLGFLFLFYMGYSLISNMSRHPVNRVAAIEAEEVGSTQPVYSSQSTVLPTPSPSPTPEPLPEYDPADYPSNPPPPVETPVDENALAVCYTQFVNCRSRNIMFNYPSDENPWSDAADQREVECITFLKYCTSSRYQEITAQEESEILNEHQQRNVNYNSPPAQPMENVQPQPFPNEGQEFNDPNYYQNPNIDNSQYQ